MTNTVPWKNLALGLKSDFDRMNAEAGDDKWDVQDYLAGLQTDVGDLAKLVLCAAGRRKYNPARHKDMELKEALAHELSDVMWSVFVIADYVGIDLEKEYPETIAKLRQELVNGK